MVQLVFPEDVNSRGTLYGGRMMYWIVTAGTLTASRCARGLVALGAMDDLDFLHPVFLGDIVTVSAQVEFIGRASLELGVDVHAENPRTGRCRRTTSSHLAFVALDDRERPRAAGAAIIPADEAETAAYAAAAARKAARAAARCAVDEGVPDEPAPGTHSVSLSRLVRPEDALSGTLMFAGKLVAALDEVAAIAAIRYCRQPTVTASVDTVYFHHPLRVGQIADFRALLTHVGRSSMEIGIRVDGEEPQMGRRWHVTTAYLTMARVGADGRPADVSGSAPPAAAEPRLWREGESRRAQRRARIRALRQRAGFDAG